MGVLREIQICEIVATGLGDKEISEQPGISIHTVKPHLRSIYSKSNIKNRSNLIVRTLKPDKSVNPSPGNYVILLAGVVQLQPEVCKWIKSVPGYELIIKECGEDGLGYIANNSAVSLVISNQVRSVMEGMMVGSLLASMDLPLPGGPIRSMLCSPEPFEGVIL